MVNDACWSPMAAAPYTTRGREVITNWPHGPADCLSVAQQPPVPVLHGDQHASALIDLLSLLRDKTQGHRSAEETGTLEDLIYDLQLRYVKAAKSSGCSRRK